MNTGGRIPGYVTGSEIDQAAGSWYMWWYFNQDRFLDLRRHVLTPGLATGPVDDATPQSLAPSCEVLLQQAIPALRRTLEKEHANDIIEGALFALARISGEVRDRAGTSLTELAGAHLRDASHEVAETAVIALGVSGDESAMLPLEALLRDTQAGRTLMAETRVPLRLRAFAACALGQLANRTALNRTRQQVARALTDVLDESVAMSTDLHAACVLALGLDALDVEKSASLSAAWISRQTEISFLLGLLADEHRPSLVRAQVPRALARLADGAPRDQREQLTRVLLARSRAASKGDGMLSRASLLALGALGSAGDTLSERDLRGELARRITSGEAGERGFAAIALAQACSRAGANGDVSGVAEGRAFLCRSLETGPMQVRSWCAIALGILEHERARASYSGPDAHTTELLRKHFQDVSTPEERGALAIGMGLCGDLHAEPLLRSSLVLERDGWTRSYVALSLGMLGSHASVPALRSLARATKSDGALLLACSTALALLGDKDVVSDLATRLEDQKGSASQDSLAESLGTVGDARALPRVLTILESTRVAIHGRGHAAHAIGLICDKDEFPWRERFANDLDYRDLPACLYAGDQSGVLEIL